MKKKTGRPQTSDSVKAQVVELRKEGKTYDDIARKFSIHPQTAFAICKAAGLVKPIKHNSKRVIATLKATIERLVREVQANEQRNADLVRQLDDLQEAFNKEKSRTWLDRLIGF